ncbi:LytTR family DNA-binding domain-containing protein [Chryseobacterium sp. S0630]|uniref:LytR/AlgR family response regulator transcription factor n=1 Tax=Chryseobacterium sp. S0630 TaxID=2957803 RepID=UPI00209FF917|nr:LytTR family DNA-binding domain-containing protein [Chryseobacterium sp. S0630]MCP1297763.1 LytTR family DNA-binding domain-containing protein [Chryseobacterium sp. S0630]
MIQPATKRYNCIIVEDEPIAAEILENFISRDQELNLLGKCADAVYASSLLSIHAVDLMFLDLHLPVIKGFDFLRNVKNPPFVIVTTAYHQYAVEGYELDIADYLMKPIPYDRFLVAIEKFKHLMEAEDALLEVSERDFIFMNSGKKKVKIILQDIFYIESLREYIHIHTKTETFTFKMPISKIEQILNPKMFTRIHKSYIISQSKIEVKSANIIQINGKQLPVGRTYKPLIEL